MVVWELPGSGANGGGVGWYIIVNKILKLINQKNALSQSLNGFASELTHTSKG